MTDRQPPEAPEPPSHWQTIRAAFRHDWTRLRVRTGLFACR
jgi:hypothetical protein